MTNTKWYKWVYRNEIANKRQPAVYFIAFSDKDISSEDFAIIEDIVYIGMTISVSGLKGRLDQFEHAMRGKNGIHGGAERVRFKHTNPDDFFNKAYISAKIFEISPSKNKPDDWRIKGDCVEHEYKSFAEYLEKYQRLPEFNDQKRSKKK